MSIKCVHFIDIVPVQRLGRFFSQAFNMGKPKANDIQQFEDHLAESSYVYIDGLRNYHQLLESKKCKWVELTDYKKYDTAIT